MLCYELDISFKNQLTNSGNMTEERFPDILLVERTFYRVSLCGTGGLRDGDGELIGSQCLQPKEKLQYSEKQVLSLTHAQGADKVGKC